jgi:hypothetical protein
MSLAARSPDAPLAMRLLVYQRERFPLVAYLPLIGLSSVGAAAWSAAARGAGALPSPVVLATGAFTAVTAFLLLRVADEHKDAELDRVARPELPVPRGLVSLRELRAAAGIAGAAAVAANLLVAPGLLPALGVVALWGALMTREFFVPAWLRARPAAYLATHMGVMPLLFLYLTGLDWLAAGVAPPRGLAAFLGLAFLNGVLVEIGRKLRAPADERPGVETYTAAWGVRAAPRVWLATLAGAAACALLAARPTGAWVTVALPVAVLAPLVALPALAFLRAPSPRAVKAVEAGAGVWTLASYLLLGVAPRLGG